MKNFYARLGIRQHTAEVLQRGRLAPLAPEAPLKQLHRAVVQVVAARHHR